MMDGNFKRYEREYLKRISDSKTMRVESHDQRKTRFYKGRPDSAQKTEVGSELDSWDYAILDTIRRGDPYSSMKFGTLRIVKSLLKLYYHDLIRKLDREPTFDEIERVQAFLDSAAYKQYKNRLQRIMTEEVQEQISLVLEILEIHEVSDLLELTDKGKDVLGTKRVEIAILYEKMNKQYANDRANFYETAPSFEWALPMLITMGFTGPVMTHMLISSDAQYSNLVHSQMGWADFGACGFEVDGFNFVAEL